MMGGTAPMLFNHEHYKKLMNDNKQQKWDSLFKLILIDKSWSKIATPADFTILEQKFNIKFPEDYQYFCQVLGSGSPDNYIRLYCLDEDRILEGRDTVEAVGWALPTSKTYTQQ